MWAVPSLDRATRLPSPLETLETAVNTGAVHRAAFRGFDSHFKWCLVSMNKDAYSKRKWTMTSTISSMAKEGPPYKWLQSCIAGKHLVWKRSQLTPWAYYSGWHLPHWIGWLHFRLKAHTAALPSQPILGFYPHALSLAFRHWMDADCLPAAGAIRKRGALFYQ